MLWAAGHHDRLLHPDSSLGRDHTGFRLSPRAHHGHMRPTKGTSKQGVREGAELLEASVGDGAASAEAEAGAGTGGRQSWGRCPGKNASPPWRRRHMQEPGCGVTSVLNTKHKGDCQKALSRERPAVTYAH